ncbi:hypothetical protein [Streptomyces phaeochromogenes]|uniref:hypothetical protein n=1 Tax=Streptomyces phaeochromogenes TaxID=1923 RepID=UPI0006E277D0|nr:hypothetical protein [Streptomyces phaeochromogenes]
MTRDNAERDMGSREDLEDLAARCASWLIQERDRMERELRSEYEESYDVPHTRSEQVARPAPIAPTRPSTARPSAPAVAAPLIGLLDRLAELPTAPDSPDSPGRGTPDPVLAWVRRTVLAALAASDVTPVDDSGPVDPARHNVVATRDDPSGRHHGAIAETVRPGYLWGGALLRHQEVIAYVRPEQRTAPNTAPELPPAPGSDPTAEPASEPNEEGGPPHDIPH